jgi:hypothetical protein
MIHQLFHQMLSATKAGGRLLNCLLPTLGYKIEGLLLLWAKFVLELQLETKLRACQGCISKVSENAQNKPNLSSEPPFWSFNFIGSPASEVM